MRFRFGRKWQSGDIVIESADALAPLPGQPRRITKGLRVEIRDHFLDTESKDAVRSYKRYAEERKRVFNEDLSVKDVQKIVETALLEHEVYGLYRVDGFWREDGDNPLKQKPVETSDDGAPEPQPGSARCADMRILGDGSTEQCPNMAEADSDFCKEHQPQPVPAGAE